jgi:hypothetical protein
MSAACVPGVIVIEVSSEGPNRIGVSLHSREEGNRSSLRNVVFSIYLEIRTMGKVQKASDSGMSSDSITSSTCKGEPSGPERPVFRRIVRLHPPVTATQSPGSLRFDG